MLGKNKIFIKIILSILLLFVIFSNSIIVRAAETGDGMIEQIEGDIGSFKDAAKNSGFSLDTGEVTKNFVSLGQILTMIGAGVMVAVTTYMGIKYLTAGPEAQAKLKTQLFGVIVSGLVIFGAYFIWKLVINIASTF